MRTRLFLAAVTLALLAGCSTNPVTGKTEFNLVSEQQELALGKEAHRDTLDQFDVYTESPELTRTVEEIGQRLAAVSDRPELEWTFTILDTPMVNAMALPGGYIYITRGMLERMNTEDEVAGVLGHEIAHVTARHATQRISRAQLAQLGLVIGAVAAGPEQFEQWGGLAQLGMGLLFQRYSRSQESQADLVGTGYSARARYNPLGAKQMLQALQRLSPQGPTGIERYFMSHPDPAKRVVDVDHRIAELRSADPSVTEAPMERDPFVRKLDHLATGRSTVNTVIRNGVVYEKRHGLVLEFPDDWEAVTGFGGLFQLSHRELENAQISVDSVAMSQFREYPSPRLAIRKSFEESGLTWVGATNARAKTGERFVVDLYAAKTQQATLGVEATHMISADRALIFIEVSPSVPRSESPLGNTIAALSIDKAKASAAKPPRVRLATARAGDSWRALAVRATGRAQDAREIAAINGYDEDDSVPAGVLLKLPEEVAN